MNLLIWPRRIRILTLSSLSMLAISTTAFAQDADLAKQLSNPLAALISVPFQFNYNQGFGPADGDQLLLNVQPVVPISLSEDWNLISRTIVPVIYQKDIFPEAGSQFGLGDINVSLFLSPKKPTSGVIWGVGPVFYFASATDDLLGADKWGAGPSAVALTMRFTTTRPRPLPTPAALVV